MAEIYYVSPRATDLELKQNIDQKTKFVIIWDDFPSGWLGKPNTMLYINDKKQSTILEMAKAFPNCCFITDRKPFNLQNFPNMIWLPLYWFYSLAFNFEKINLNFEKKRFHTAHYISGQYRISRVLSAFWLAKNYPINQLIYSHRKENSDLSHLIDVIKFSKKTSNKHLSPKLCLQPKWEEPKFENLDPAGFHQQFIDHWYRLFFEDCYVSFLSADNGIDLTTSVSEKVFYSMLSGLLPLHLGNYQINHVLKSMGFETFEDILNFNHLDSTDRYHMTIGGLESNKNFCCDHHAVESAWFDNRSRLEHNRKLCLDKSKWLGYFSHEINIFKNVLKLESQSGCPKWLGYVIEYFGWKI